jgi:predicted RNase H-like HicB family nuclease
MTVRTFNAVFEDAGDGWVYAHVPKLPEVQTQGDSLEDARRMVREAIALVLEERMSLWRPLIAALAGDFEHPDELALVNPYMAR